MEKDKRLAAANLLLERGVRFNITDAPFYFRLIGLNPLIIRPLFPGTIMEISRTILEENLEKISPDEAVIKMPAICKVIAIAVLNDKRKLRRTDQLAKSLLVQIPIGVLLRIFMHVVDINKVMDFTIITDYFSNQMNQMMMVKNTGQNEGS